MQVDCRIRAAARARLRDRNRYDPDFSDYWRWNGPVDREKTVPFKNRILHRIVEIFERHGFIWGGKWYHYDTMHFEYRPEMME